MKRSVILAEQETCLSNDIIEAEANSRIGGVVEDSLQAVMDNQDQFSKSVDSRYALVSSGLRFNPGQKRLRRPMWCVGTSRGFKDDPRSPCVLDQWAPVEKQAGHVLGDCWVSAEISPYRLWIS